MTNDRDTAASAGASIRALPVRDLLDAVAGDAPTPGGGAACGVVAGLAGALAAMAGRYTDGARSGAPDVVETIRRADELRRRAEVLADADTDAYDRYARAVADHDVDPQARRGAVRAALDAAADVPVELGGVAVDIAELGEKLAVGGNPLLRSDACIAVLLAAAAATGAAVLVQENLRARPDDPRITLARRTMATAWAAATRAVAEAGLSLSDRSNS